MTPALHCADGTILRLENIEIDPTATMIVIPGRDGRSRRFTATNEIDIDGSDIYREVVETTKPHIRQTSDGKWAVVDVPNDWRDGDLLPAPSSSDRYYNREGEAMQEFLRRLPQPEDA